MSRARDTAALVRAAFPLSYVSVRPCHDAPSLVSMRCGRGAWLRYTVVDALQMKREWRMRTMRKRKERVT